jgi:PAS domain S-box-containing protein
MSFVQTPQSTESAHRALDAMPVAVAIVDGADDRRISYINSAFTRLTGYALADVIGSTPLALVDSHSDPVITQQWRTALQDGAPFAAQMLITSRDAGAAWMRISMQPFEPGSLVLTLEDITAHNAARASAWASEARLDVAMQAGELSMWDWNVPRDEVYYNDQWRISVGIDPHELLKRQALHERLMLADEPEVLDAFERHFRGGTDDFEYEYELPTAFGKPKWFLARARVVARDEKGRAQRVIGVLQDISRRKQYLQESHDIQQRWERAVHGTSDGLYDWDLLTGHVWYAARFREIVGYSAAEFPDTFNAFQSVVFEADRVRMLTSIRAHLENRQPLDVRCRIRTGSGTLMWCRMRGEAERSAGGRPLRLAGAISDISAQVDAEQALRQSQKMEAVGRLTGGIAHDFNNLLAVIIGNTQLLSRSLRESPRLLKQADTALRAALRGGELTSRLLAFARQQVLEPKVVDLNAMIGGMYEFLRRSLTGEIEIHQQSGNGLWPVKVDPGQLENAVLNLVINARDAMPTGGTIRIATRNVVVSEAAAVQRAIAADEAVKPGEYVLLEISDTGMGMSPDTLKRAFEPFFTTKDAGKGSGLGLSMVYGFVKQSEGHINVTSTPGEGTSVHVYFPRTQAVAERVSLDGGAHVESLPHGDETILVVEDNPEVRSTAVEILGSLGYRVLEASNGHQALERFMQHPDIALVFSDVMLSGGLLGTSLVSKLRERRAGLKVLMTTGFSESAIMNRGLLDGSIALIGKPYKVEELARRVRTILDEPEESQRVTA